MVQAALNNRGYAIRRIDHCNVLQYLLHTMVRRTGKVSLVQIGANDGRMADPLYEFVRLYPASVQGLVVEPISDYFDRLKVHYATCPGIKPVRVAIHHSQETMTMYRVDATRAPGLPRFAAGIASFDPTHYQRSGIPAEAIVDEQVPCRTLGGLLQEHGLNELDLLQIDTEGYDAEILRAIDFSRHRIHVIRFEHGRFNSMSKSDFVELRGKLRDHGYDIMIEPRDATAYLPSTVLDL